MNKEIVQALSHLSIRDPNPLPPKCHNDTKSAVWNMERSCPNISLEPLPAN